MDQNGDVLAMPQPQAGVSHARIISVILLLLFWGSLYYLLDVRFLRFLCPRAMAIYHHLGLPLPAVSAMALQFGEFLARYYWILLIAGGLVAWFEYAGPWRSLLYLTLTVACWLVYGAIQWALILPLEILASKMAEERGLVMVVVDADHDLKKGITNAMKPWRRLAPEEQNFPYLAEVAIEEYTREPQGDDMQEIRVQGKVWGYETGRDLLYQKHVQEKTFDVTLALPTPWEAQPGYQNIYQSEELYFEIVRAIDKAIGGLQRAGPEVWQGTLKSCGFQEQNAIVALHYQGDEIVYYCEEPDGIVAASLPCPNSFEWLDYTTPERLAYKLQCFSFHKFQEAIHSYRDRGYTVSGGHRSQGYCFQGEFQKLAISPLGFFALGLTGDGRMVFWNIEKEQEIAEFSAPDGVGELAFGGNGHWAALVDGAGEISAWDLYRGYDSAVSLGKFPGTVRALVGHPGGKLFFAAGDKEGSATNNCIYAYDFDEKKQVAVLGKNSGHTAPIYALDVSVDGRYLISGGKTICIWEIATGKLLEIFNMPSPARSVTFTDFHRKFAFAVGLQDGQILLLEKKD